MNPKIIGISGQFGTGKNFLSEKLSQQLAVHGKTSSETTYATALKTDATELINYVKNHPEGFKSFSQKFNIPEDATQKIYTIIKQGLTTYPNLTGWMKTPQTRELLQFFGTDVRRKQNPMHWVERLRETVTQMNTDYIFIPDVRFPDEADNIKDYHKGFLYRLEVPLEVIRQRLLERDGYAPDPTDPVFQHSSEHKLDNYLKFDVTIGATYDPEELVKYIL